MAGQHCFDFGQSPWDRSDTAENNASAAADLLVHVEHYRDAYHSMGPGLTVENLVVCAPHAWARGRNHDFRHQFIRRQYVFACNIDARKLEEISRSDQPTW